MSTAIAEPVAAVTHQEIDELRWLVREILTTRVVCLEEGPSDKGAFADVERIVVYARALAALGRDCDVIVGWWSPYTAAERLAGIDSLSEDVAELTAIYEDCALHDKRAETTTRRVANARGILERLLGFEAS